jgi:regulator of protease activity HflC (stomatin/prohibitin superfamily)
MEVFNMFFFLVGIILMAASVVFYFFGKENAEKFIKPKMYGIGGTVLGFLMFISSMIVVIDAGEVGVKVIFGNVQKDVLESGINLVAPYADIYKYPTRIMELTQVEQNVIDARVNNGLTIKLDCTVWYNIDKTKVADIYTQYAKTLGELESKILLSSLRTAIRNVVSKYSSEEVYSSKREQVSNEIEKALRQDVLDTGLLINKFLIRSIRLPEEIDKAIQLKISAQQEAEAMQYKKQKATQEADIKIIEAQGLARAQQIINSTLTPYYLQHEAIQAYTKLAGSPNTTFVILPTSPNSAGMPLILNTAK